MSRRGSYIAEAAVVLPLVILAVITVVLIVMFFYEESTAQSRLHMELRQEAAAVTGRVPEELAGESTDGAADVGASGAAGSVSSLAGSLRSDAAVLETKRDGMFKNISGYVYVRMIDGGLLSSVKESRIEDSWHGADGVLYKRLFD